MSERLSDASDEVLGRRLAAELPRHAAPPRLRAAILEAAAPQPRRTAWLPPVLSALATAMVLGLAFVPTLPRSVPTDPTGELLRSVLAEYTRAALWGARRAEALPAGLPWLAHESGIGLALVPELALNSGLLKGTRLVARPLTPPTSGSCSSAPNPSTSRAGAASRSPTATAPAGS